MMTREMKRLGDYIFEYSVRNKSGDDIPVYSVTNTNGFCTEYFDKDVASKDQTNYKIVPNGYFAYNPSRINVGSIDCQRMLDKVVVSPLYVVFGVNEQLDPEYLLYFLKSDIGRTYIGELASGSVRANLKFSILQEFMFPMVSLEKQKENVDVLNRLNAVLNICDRLIKTLDDTVKSRFVEMFGDPVNNEMGWNTMSLEKACSAIVDCPHSTPKYTDEDTGYMCIRTSIVKRNHIEWDNIEYISEEEFRQRIKRRKPQKGDIVYTREGGILGIAAIIDRGYDVALGQRSMLLSPNRELCLPDYLCTTMNMDSFFNKMTQEIMGSAAPHINVGDIKDFNIMLPPIEEQNRFVFFLKEIDKSKLAIRKIAEKIQVLRDSMMQQYFG